MPLSTLFHSYHSDISHIHAFPWFYPHQAGALNCLAWYFVTLYQNKQSWYACHEIELGTFNMANLYQNKKNHNLVSIYLIYRCRGYWGSTNWDPHARYSHGRDHIFSDHSSIWRFSPAKHHEACIKQQSVDELSRFEILYSRISIPRSSGNICKNFVL